jgi:hypothetical protein
VGRKANSGRAKINLSPPLAATPYLASLAGLGATLVFHRGEGELAGRASEWEEIRAMRQVSATDEAGDFAKTIAVQHRRAEKKG